MSSTLSTVPEHASFPVVPPPPLYSEPEESSSNKLHHKTVPAVEAKKKEPPFTPQVLPHENSHAGFTDVPPPLLGTEATLKTQDVKEKDHDSGFDQSPEILTRTPAVDLSEDAPLQNWEDPDSGSGLDVISTIPPPVDFATTRPITPPCQFANPTVAPPVGFVEEQEPEQVKPRKKLNISEALFPWMNEPQAPLNATVPLAVSDGLGKVPELEMVNREDKVQFDENGQGISNRQDCCETTTPAGSGTVVEIRNSSVAQKEENPIIEEPPEPEFVTEPRVESKGGVNEAPRMELPRSLSIEGSKGSVVAPKVDIKDSNETNQVTVVSDKSKEKEQFGSQQGFEVIAKPVKPKPKPKPVKLVKEAEVEIEANVSVHQAAPSSVNLFTEVARPEPQVEAVKLERQVKPEIPEKRARPVEIVKEPEIKVEAHTPSPFIVPIDSTRSEPQVEVMRQDPLVKPEKPETQAKPVEPEAEIDDQDHVPSSINPVVEQAVEAVKPVKPDAVTPDQGTEVKDETRAPSSFIPSVNGARPEQQVLPSKPEPLVKPEQPETRVEPVAFVKETEVEVEPKVDVQPFNPSIEVAKVEPQENPVKPVLQVKPEKPEPLVKPEQPETRVKPVAFVEETEVEVEPKVDVQPFNPSIEVAKVEPQFNPVKQVLQVKPEKPEPLVKPEQPETRVKPVAFVKEKGVEVEPKVDVAKVEPQFNSVKPVLQVKPEKPEKLQSRADENVVIPLVKPKEEENVNMLEVEQSGPSWDMYEVKSEINAPLEDTGVTIINVGEDVVVETPVTPETKPARLSNDRLRDLEERLQELDKDTVPSSKPEKSDTNTTKKPYLEKPTVQSKDPFAEDVIVAKTKQVESSSYGQFDELLKLNSEDEPVKHATSVTNKDKNTDAVVEKQNAHPEGSKPRTDADAELRLDLSSLQQTSEPPRPPSSTPPDTTPRSSILPSPRELLSDRSTESGISLTDESRIPSDSVEPHGDKETAAVNNASVAIKPQPREKPTDVFAKLQRPLSMPSGIFRDFKSEAVPEKRPSVTDSDSRKSSWSDSTGVSSSSLPSSPIESGITTEPVELPKPPPFTVPPLRRYSDLASDLSFVSSAAKVAEKTNESEIKADVPPKPANLALKRSAASVVERPRSWMGPETNNNKRSSPVWSSAAFKPVSFDSQGGKVARPVTFDAKSFTGSSGGATAASTGNTTAVKTLSDTERKSSPNELEKSSNNAPLLAEKPSGSLTGKPRVPVVSPLVKEEASSSQKPASTDTNSNPLLKKTEPRETKYEIVYSNNSSESKGASKDHQGKSGFGTHGPSKDVSSSASIREQIMRDATGGNRLNRPRPQSGIVGGASWADVKKLAALQASGVKTEDASRAHTNKHRADVPSKPDVPHPAAKPPQLVKTVDSKPEVLKSAESKPQAGSIPDVKTDPVNTADIKPQPVKPADDKQPMKATDSKPKAVKPADVKPQPTKVANSKPKAVKPTDIKPQPVTAADSAPLPTIVMRAKKGSQDPAKRHSMPAYIIEGADRKATPMAHTSGGGQVWVCHLLVKIVIKEEDVGEWGEEGESVTDL